MIDRYLSLLVAIVLGCGSVHAGQDDRSIVTIRHMPASPDQVIRAFVDGDALSAWWKTTRSLVEPEAGGVWSVAWDDWGAETTQHAWTGVIRDIGPGRLAIAPMVMNEPGMPLMGPMRLEILAEPAADGSTVTVIHAGYGHGDHWDEMYRLVVDGWDHVLGDMQHWFRARGAED